MITTAIRAAKAVAALLLSRPPAHAATHAVVSDPSLGKRGPSEAATSSSGPAPLGRARCSGPPEVELLPDWRPHPTHRVEFHDDTLGYLVGIWSQEASQG